jgi:hypothetical protein
MTELAKAVQCWEYVTQTTILQMAMIQAVQHDVHHLKFEQINYCSIESTENVDKLPLLVDRPHRIAFC